MNLNLVKQIVALLLILAGTAVLWFLTSDYTSRYVDARIIKRELLVDRKELPEGDYKVKGVKRNIYYEFRGDDGRMHRGKKSVTHWAWEKYRHLDVIDITYSPYEIDASPSVIIQILRLILGAGLTIGGIILWNKKAIF